MISIRLTSLDMASLQKISQCLLRATSISTLFPALCDLNTVLDGTQVFNLVLPCAAPTYTNIHAVTNTMLRFDPGCSRT